MSPQTNSIFFQCIFYLSLVTLTLVHAQAPGPDAQGKPGEIRDAVCKKSEDEQFCLTTFKSNPDSETATLTQLGIIAFKLASRNGSDTSVYIKRRIIENDETFEPALEDALQDCSKNYLDATEQMDNSLSALLANAYADVDVWGYAAIADAEACKNKLADGDKELVERNENFLRLTKNAMIINDKLAPN